MTLPNNFNTFKKKPKSHLSFYDKEKERYFKQLKEKELLKQVENKKEEDKIKNLSNNQYFPSISNSEYNNDDNNYLKFENIIENELITSNSNTNNSNTSNSNTSNSNTNNSNTNNSNTNNSNTSNSNKWLILNKKNLVKYKEEKDKEKIIKYNNENIITQNDINNCFNILSSRWNNYRDEINYLLGDISPYINYREEIQNMIFQDNLLFEEIYKVTNYYSSDDDNNDYENDDFYYSK